MQEDCGKTGTGVWSRKKAVMRGGGNGSGCEQDSRLVDEAVKYVMSRCDRELGELTVAKLARALDVDRFKLTREFKSRYDMNLDAYILREKMIRSAFKIGSVPGLTAKVIAKQMGFCNEQYFGKVFRDFHGISPAAYQEYKQLRSGVKDRRKKTGKTAKTAAPQSPSVERRKGIKDRREDDKESTGRVSIQDLLKMMRQNEHKN